MDAKTELRPDFVYNILKKEILECIFQPDERLVEKALCERYSVSRTPVREALNRLELEGLVVARPHAGFRVTPLTIESFRHHSELRHCLEPEIAAKAAEKASSQERLELIREAELSFDHQRPETYREYMVRNREFHLGLAKATRNPRLLAIMSGILDQHQQPAFLGVIGKSSSQTSSAEHSEIAQAVAEGRSHDARRLMSEHISSGEIRIIRGLRMAGFPEFEQGSDLLPKTAAS